MTHIRKREPLRIARQFAEIFHRAAEPAAPAPRTAPAADDWSDWHHADEWNRYEIESPAPRAIVKHGELMPEVVGE